MRGIYEVTDEIYSIAIQVPGGNALLTTEQCKALEEALYEARTAMPYKLQKKPEPV